MQDKIKITVTVDADFNTLQDIRQHLNGMVNRDSLIRSIEKLFNEKLSGMGSFKLSVGEFKSPKRQRTSKGKRQPIPRIIGDTLHSYNIDTQEFDVVGKIGSYEFANYLDSEKSFSYRTEHGLKFTGIRRGSVWYAVRQLKGVKQRRYLGNHADFTYRKLHNMAFKLAQTRIEPIENMVDKRQARF